MVLVQVLFRGAGVGAVGDGVVVCVCVWALCGKIDGWMLGC